MTHPEKKNILMSYALQLLTVSNIGNHTTTFQQMQSNSIYSTAPFCHYYCLYQIPSILLFVCLPDTGAGLSNLHCYQLLDKRILVVVTSRTSSVKCLLLPELQAHYSKGCITYQHIRCKTSQNL